MPNWHLLTFTTFLPLVGAAAILLLRGKEEHVARNARWVALWASLCTFVLSLLIPAGFDPAEAGYQMVEKVAWLPEFNIAYHMGVDGISLPFVALSTFLVPLCVAASWTSIKTRVREYMAAFLLLETMMVGMFCALDLVLFYIFFEGVLIPMFLIIGVWGGPRRVYAAFKFFLYTLLGSVLMLLAVLVMYRAAGTSDIPTITATRFGFDTQIWLWLAMFASFAVKVPMWPVHTWLPDAHVEAPTAGSVVLAGVLLKMGGYGFLRFSIPILPEATQWFVPLVFALSVIAVVYTSLVALAQEDMKKLIAYSSVAHMGIVTVGMFALNGEGLRGSIFQMLSHGVVSGALFLCVGVVYDRLHTREIARYGGVVHRMPVFAVIFMFMTLASIGLPGTSGFVGEFMVMLGVFKVSTWIAALSGLGMILGAAYMLWLMRRVVFGPVVHDDVRTMRDLSPREIAIFLPLIVVVLWLGVFPSSVLNVSSASVDRLIQTYTMKLAEAQPGSVVAER